MDGSAADLIVIPIVVVISLAAWLILVAYAASHPEWRGRSQASAQGKQRPVALADQPRPDASVAAPAEPGRERVHQKAA
jgi:hypothetical protein